jgi:3-isopropylmalate/(R)-2-methylmalate dehydratase small subunit
LPILECPEAASGIPDGAEVEYDLAAGAIVDFGSGRRYAGAPFPDLVQEIVSAGGLVGYVRRRIGGG